MEEIWKEITGFEGYYEVSTDGRIRGVERRVMCPFDKHIIIKSKPKSVSRFRTGYLYVNLYKEHKTYKRLIHRLVAEAFIPNPNNKPCIDHIDGDRTNNNVDNLRWCTHSENANNPITRQRLKAKPINWEHLKDLHKKQRGRHLSDETKRRISESQKKRWIKLKN